MTDNAWNLDASTGELVVKTRVAGRAARMGHRLTIAMKAWSAKVTWSGDEPSAVELDVAVRSLEVLRGEGGVTPLTGPEKSLAGSNALKSLEVQHFPSISFRTDGVAEASGGYRLTGSLEIHGKSRTQTVDLKVEDLGDSWQMSTKAQVLQSDFGVKPYSLFMGTMKVADEVTVTFTATHPKDV
jgi:polyisoprenoid-binding protein YceI